MANGKTVLGMKAAEGGGGRELRSGKLGKKYWEEEKVPAYKRHEMRLQKGVYGRQVERNMRVKGNEGGEEEELREGGRRGRGKRRRLGAKLWVPGGIMAIVGIFLMKVTVGVRVGVGWDGLMWRAAGEAGLREWWGRFGKEEEVLESVFEHLKKNLVLELCVLAVVGRAMENIARGRAGSMGRTLVLVAGMARCTETVAFYLGSLGVTDVWGGEAAKKIEKDIPRLMEVMKWGEIGKVVFGIAGVVLLTIGLAIEWTMGKSKKKE